jgi:hypothetical protein
MICKCGNEIPKKRVELGYNSCVECSTEKKASGHLVVHHKTGNEIQVIKDPETAAKMASMSNRNGFGSNRRAIAKEGVDTKKKVAPPEDFRIEPKLLAKKPADTSKWEDEACTLAVLDKLSEGQDSAKGLLDSLFSQGRMSPIARKRLLVIIGVNNS